MSELDMFKIPQSVYGSQRTHQPRQFSFMDFATPQQPQPVKYDHMQSFFGGQQPQIELPQLPSGQVPGQPQQPNVYDMFANFRNQQDLSNLQDSWWGGNYLRDDMGKIQTDINGNPIMENGMNGSDMVGLGGAAVQGIMGYNQNREKMDIARDNLRLKQRAYNDTRSDARRLDEATRAYGVK